MAELHIPAAPLRSTDEFFENEQLQAIDFFEAASSPYGKVTYPGVPTWFSATPGKVAGHSPTLGEHTAEVLAELRVDAD